MPLSIKDPVADRLARELAARTGQTITQAVIGALRAGLDRADRQPGGFMVEDAMAIGRHCATLPTLDDRSDDDIVGYDDQGAPSR